MTTPTYRIEMFNTLANETIFFEVKANGIISSMYIAHRQWPAYQLINSKLI